MIEGNAVSMFSNIRHIQLVVNYLLVHIDVWHFVDR